MDALPVPKDSLIAYMRLDHRKKQPKIGDILITDVSTMFCNGTQFWCVPHEVLRHYPGEKNRYVQVEIDKNTIFKHGQKMSARSMKIIKIMSHKKFVSYCTGEFENYDGDLYRLRNGLIHSTTQPALVMKNGDEYWYRNGKLHRNGDEPAVTKVNGDRYWYQNGKLHRDNNLPAVTTQFGTYWYVKGKPFRTDGGPNAILLMGDGRVIFQ